MIKKCKICDSELFEDEKGELFCPDCEAEEFLEDLEEQTPLTQLSVYNLLDTIQEEKFLTQETHFE